MRLNFGFRLCSSNEQPQTKRTKDEDASAEPPEASSFASPSGICNQLYRNIIAFALWAFHVITPEHFDSIIIHKKKPKSNQHIHLNRGDKVEMATLFTLFGTIAINADSANKTIESTSKNAGELAQQFSATGEAGISIAKKVKNAIAAIGLTQAVGSFAKATIGAYADYEQLVGGVETLFKESKDKVMEYANSAYMTAGMSANEYMEIVTGFSASLLQGLNGDTEKAAEFANLALIDMSDNANKFGSDITSVQNAYQGFAKQNYTMLDNLKLGYGGTAAEMARLINDSGVLGAAVEVTAETVKEVPFDKIIEAIHVTQEEMGITGTTAKEASETISGSFGSMEAAWNNLLIGISSGDQNVDRLFNNLTETGKTFAKNIIDLLPSIVSNLEILLASAAQFISDEWVNTLWPMIQDFFKLKFGIELPDWSTIVSSFNEKIEAIKGFVSNLIEKWEALKQGISNVAETVNAFFSTTLPDWWEGSVITPILTAWGNVISKVEAAIAAVKSFFGLKGWESSEAQADFESKSGGVSFEDWSAQIESGNWYPNGSHASGLANVPFDGYRAILHKREAVLTADQADAWRSGSMGGADVSRLETAINNLSAMMKQVVANTGREQAIVLDSGALVGQLAPQMDARLGTLASRKGRGI